MTDIRPGEERVLTYRIVPVVELSGMIRLPEASVAFMRGNKEIENKSSATFIGLDQENNGLHHRLHSHIKSFFLLFSFKKK